MMRRHGGSRERTTASGPPRQVVRHLRGRQIEREGHPRRVLGGYGGPRPSDSWPAWNHVGTRWQRCLVHYRRELEDTVKYKSPGAGFFPFRKKLRRILRDAIRMADDDKKKKDHEERLRARFEAKGGRADLVLLIIEREELRQAPQVVEEEARHACSSPSSLRRMVASVGRIMPPRGR